MMKRKTITIIAVLVSILVSQILGCDRRPIKQSNKNPFSAAGIALGDSRIDVEKNSVLQNCASDTKDIAVCKIDETNIRYMFFGKFVDQVRVKFYEPYTHVSGVEFYTKGQLINSKDIEKEWDIAGQCLSRAKIDEATSFDPQETNYFKRALSDFDLLPSNPEDFVCLKSNGAFLKFTAGTDREFWDIKIMYLTDVFYRNYEYIYRAVNARSSARKEVDSTFARKLAEPEPSSEVLQLIKITEKLNDKCRGGSGDSPDTFIACDERTEAMAKLESLKWCWGPKDVSGSEQHWIMCSSQK